MSTNPVAAQAVPASPYRNPAFRRLLVGWTLTNIGDSALFLTLAIWAKDLTGSNSAAGLVFLALAAPMLIGPVLGHLVDRVRRRPMLITVNVMAAGAVLVLLLVDDPGDVWILFAVAAGYGLVGILTGAAQSGLLKDLLPDEQLDTANAALTTIDQGLRLISPLIGAGLYTVWGGTGMAVLASATFVLAVVALITVRVAESAIEPAEPGHYLRDVLAGFALIRRVPVLLRMVVACAVSFAVIGFFDSLLFAVVEEGLGREPEFFGVLISAQGAGSIIGGVTAVRALRGLGPLVAMGIALGGIGIAAFTLLVPQVVVVAAGMFVSGLAIPWLVVALTTVRQRASPPRMQGRTATAVNMALSLPQIASIATGAALISVVDYRVLSMVAALVLLGTAGWLITSRHRVAGVDRSAAVDHPKTVRA